MWPFNKKEVKKSNYEEEIPELPELPELPPMPEFSENKFRAEKRIKNELPPLPSFPTSKTGEKISNETIKNTIREMPEEFTIEAPEMPDYEEIQKIPKRTVEIEEKYSTPIRTRLVKEISPSIKEEPVFVRIDKYQSALKQFQEIKKRIMEIDNLLEDIKEIKNKEESELKSWEEEIQEAKNKLNDIDKTLFQKLEE